MDMALLRLLNSIIQKNIHLQATAAWHSFLWATEVSHNVPSGTNNHLFVVGIEQPSKDETAENRAASHHQAAVAAQLQCSFHQPESAGLTVIHNCKFS